jgi:hypothetical protein
LIGARASEPVRRAVAVAPEPDAPGNYVARRYTRAGGVVGLSWDLTRQLTLLGGLRAERLRTDGALGAGAYLHDGTSWLTTAGLGLQLDTRSDPVLPWSGDLAVVYVEAGGAATGSDYEEARLRARWQHYVPLAGDRHVLSFAVGGEVVLGDDPAGIDLLYTSDLSQLLPPRPLELTVSTQRPLDLLGENSAAPRLGTAGGVVALEYRYRLFRRTRLVYGGDLFVGAGLYGLRGEAPACPAGEPCDLDADRVLDLTFDLGLRLDTEIGIFELSLGNAIGRLPL